MLENLIRKVNDLIQIKPVDIFYQLFLDPEFNELIIRLNTEGEQTSQLIYGVNSKGQHLDDIGGEYSPYTIMRKRDKGQIIDHVTLKDTGYFYASFKTYWIENEGSIQITADTVKDGVDNLIDRWGRDIIGLDDQNISVLVDYARTKIADIIRAKLNEAP